MNTGKVHPRPYLSYSQMVLWESSLEAYIRQYLHGEKRGTNRGQALGKELADAMETGIESGKAEIDIVASQLPRYEIRDKEIRCWLSTAKGKERHFVPVLVKPDSTRTDYAAFYEYKTGAGPWTQARVDKDDQMTFYTAGLYLKVKEGGGIEIPKGELIWAPTEIKVDEDGVERPHLTGEIVRFPTSRTFVQILAMHVRMAKAWREIGDATESEILNKN